MTAMNLLAKSEISQKRRLADNEHERRPWIAIYSRVVHGRHGVVEDGTVGKQREISRESLKGTDPEFMARRRPKSRSRQAVRAPIVATKWSNVRRAKGRRKMDARRTRRRTQDRCEWPIRLNKPEKLRAVSGSGRNPPFGAQRMLNALERGVKGGVFDRNHSSDCVRDEDGKFSSEDHQLESRMREIRQFGLGGGVVQSCPYLISSAFAKIRGISR